MWCWRKEEKSARGATTWVKKDGRVRGDVRADRVFFSLNRTLENGAGGNLRKKACHSLEVTEAVQAPMETHHLPGITQSKE